MNKTHVALAAAVAALYLLASHGLYEIVPVARPADLGGVVFRLNRLTGTVSICYPGGVILGCRSLSEGPPMPAKETQS
jgi:hypothetical protein